MRHTLALAALAVFCVVRSSPAADTGLDYNQNLFTVLAALNAAGYDAGIDSPDNSPLRKQLRDYLAKQNIPVLPQIRDFYKYKSPSISPYLSLALSLNGPPDYGWRTRTVDIPPDAYALESLLPLLTRFYAEAKIEELWKRVQPAYDNALEPYHEPLSKITLEINSYLRNPAAGYLGRRFQVYIDLLAAPNQVQSRSYGDDYFVIVTPAKQPNIFELRHAYLHFVVEPLASKYGKDIMQNAPLSDYVIGAPGLDDTYKNDFLLLVTESFIKAIETRLDHTPAQVDEALHQGYILTPYFAEALASYEHQPVAMRLYFPDIIANIDRPRERKRLEGVSFAAKPKQDKAAAAEPPPPPLSASGKVLVLAEAAYTKEDYEKAKGYFLKALEERGEGPDHAKAYYGLARIALRQKDPELAERLLRKTLEMSPDPQTRTWALVYLGRLADATGDREQASKHYRAALAVEGGSDQARKAAEKGIQESYKK